MPSLPRAKPCRLCGKRQHPEYAPFCSRGCKSRDLLKWLGEGYRIPGPAGDVEQELGGVDSEEGEG